MLRSRASALQRAMSACMKLPNCSGVIGIGSIASPERRSRSAGAAIALLISALSLLVISAGSFAGPTIPYHCTPSKPLNPDAAVVTVYRVEARGRPELLEREVVEQADPTRAVVQLLRILLRITDEAGELGDRDRRNDDQDIGRAADHRDRREVLDGVVRELAHGGIGAVSAHIPHHQRVAVRRGARHGERRDAAAPARDVLDDERLPERAAELTGDGAADQIQAAAGLGGDDDFHGPGGIGLRRAELRQQRDRGEERGDGDGTLIHGETLLCVTEFSPRRIRLKTWPGGTRSTPPPPGANLR